MKNLKVLISSMTFIAAFSINAQSMASPPNTIEKDSIYIWTGPDLFDLAKTWVSAYSKNNPEAKIKVSNVAVNNVNYKIGSIGNIGLITKNELPVLDSKNLWKMSVGTDIIVPVMNSENPFLEEIKKKGISREEFKEVYTDKGNPKWGRLLNLDISKPINIYSIRNESIKPYLADFLQTDLSKINTKEASGTEQLLNKILSDKYSIGFCRLGDILDSESHQIQSGLSIIPIDINGNDKVDYFENIYANSNSIERGVWIGKYPKVLYSNIYVVSTTVPTNTDELAFFKWVLTDGQQYLYTSGYSGLIYSDSQKKVQSLFANQVPIIDAQKPLYTFDSIFLLVLIFASAIIIFIAMKYLKKRNEIGEADTFGIQKVLNESSMLAPNGYFFDKSHTWAYLEKDGGIRIGIADFLQHVTGVITKVKMKNPGESIKKGQPLVTIIQHGKQLNLQSPISGTIKEINSQLNTDSSIINSAPYSDGWLYVIESSSWLKEIKFFLMGETYKAWLKNEFYRLKYFFSSIAKQQDTNNLQLVIQDGGEMVDNPMENFGPEIWEEFQSFFIDRVK